MKGNGRGSYRSVSNATFPEAFPYTLFFCKTQ
jgi:hypothetical protein